MQTCVINRPFCAQRSVRTVPCGSGFVSFDTDRGGPVKIARPAGRPAFRIVSWRSLTLICKGLNHAHRLPRRPCGPAYQGTVRTRVAEAIEDPIPLLDPDFPEATEAAITRKPGSKGLSVPPEHRRGLCPDIGPSLSCLGVKLTRNFPTKEPYAGPYPSCRNARPSDVR